MKSLAYTFIALGFLAGSLIAVQTPKDEVTWPLYGPALLLGIIGVALARWAARRQARHSTTLHVNRQHLVARLSRIVANARQLEREKEELSLADVHWRIDQLFRADLKAFAEVRETIAHLHGLPAYAAVMNEFAAGERYLNRAWSAAVDGYVDEVREYLSRATRQFEQAQAALQRHGAGNAAGS